jgi:hypothetical protein
MESEWLIAWEKYKLNYDKAFDFRIESWDLKPRSFDYKIVKLYEQKYNKLAKRYLNKAEKELNKYVQTFE